MLIKAPYQFGQLESLYTKEGHMPFSKFNPGTVIESKLPSARAAKRQEKRAARQSGKHSPSPTREERNWQRNCRPSNSKPS